MAVKRLFSFIFLSLQCTIIIADFKVTCDLDLPAAAIEQLPEECKELTAEQRQLAIEEAKAFAEWNNELNKYEERKDPGYDGIPKKQWELREKMAIEGEKYDCTGKEVEEYYKCLKERRDKMIELIPKD